jgi:hypothetical protein
MPSASATVSLVIPTWLFGVLLAGAMALLIGCAGTAGPSPPAAPVQLDTAATTVAVAPMPTAASAVPAELVGAWSSAEGNAEIAYRFLTDGRFRSAQILNQLRPGGVFEFRVVQEGTVEVTGDQLVVRPTLSVKSLTDPDDPRRSYTDQPASLEEEAYTWRVTGSTLLLQSTDGVTLTFARQP